MIVETYNNFALAVSILQLLATIVVGGITFYFYNILAKNDTKRTRQAEDEIHRLQFEEVRRYSRDQFKGVCNRGVREITLVAKRIRDDYPDHTFAIIRGWTDLRTAEMPSIIDEISLLKYLNEVEPGRWPQGI